MRSSNYLLFYQGFFIYTKVFYLLLVEPEIFYTYRYQLKEVVPNWIPPPSVSFILLFHPMRHIIRYAFNRFRNPVCTPFHLAYTSFIHWIDKRHDSSSYQCPCQHTFYKISTTHHRFSFINKFNLCLVCEKKQNSSAEKNKDDIIVTFVQILIFRLLVH